MTWVARMLAGPGLWAVLFCAVYGLHGLGCAWDWPARQTPLGPLHPLGMIALWLAGLAVHGALIVLNGPRGDGTQAGLIRAGNWIGAVASAVTLFPVIAASTCG